MTVTQANCLHCKLRVAKLHLTRTFMAKWWLSELRDEWIYHCLWQRRAGCQVNQTTTKNKWRMGAAGYYGQRRVQTLHCTKMVLNGRMIKHLLKLVDIFIDMLCWISLKLYVQSCHSNSWVPRVLPGDSVFFFCPLANFDRDQCIVRLQWESNWLLYHLRVLLLRHNMKLIFLTGHLAAESPPEFIFHCWKCLNNMLFFLECSNFPCAPCERDQSWLLALWITRNSQSISHDSSFPYVTLSLCPIYMSIREEVLGFLANRLI